MKAACGSERMRITTDRIGVLLAYGFSEYQARVYLGLLEFPSLSAGSLAKVAHVPRNRLYEVLEELHSLGLVEIIPDETRKYRANPLSRYLDRRVSDLRSEIGEIESRKEYLAVAFQPPAAADGEGLESGATRVILGRRAVSREIDRILEGAKEHIAACGSLGGVDRVVRHLARRNPAGGGADALPVTLDLFLPKASRGPGGLERLGGAVMSAVHWVEIPTQTIAFVVDRRELLIIQPVPDDDNLQAGRDFALLTTNPAFVRDYLAFITAAAGVKPTPESAAR